VVVYDPRVTYGQILRVFFSVAHDPTQLNRQGPDTGHAIRSAILRSEEQKKIEEATSRSSTRPVRIRSASSRVDAVKPSTKRSYPGLPQITRRSVHRHQRSSEGAQLRAHAASAVRREAGDRAQAHQSRATAPVNGGAVMAAAESRPQSSEGGDDVAQGQADRRKRAAACRWGDGCSTAALTPEPSRQGRGRRFLGVLVHQLPARAVREPYRHYKDRDGHTRCALAEFAFERHRERARSEKVRHQYVALDNEMAIWKQQQQVLARALFRRRQGQIRGHHFGRENAAKSEREIRRLLTEAGAKNLPDPLDDAAGVGVAAPADTANVASPETYVGYARAENCVSPGLSLAMQENHAIRVARSTSGRWLALAGCARHARLGASPGRIAFSSRRDHLVLGPATPGKPVRFRVTIGGAPPRGCGHGVMRTATAWCASTGCISSFERRGL
jgi:hypothetical protein